MEYQIFLTADECDFIHALLYYTVGGTPHGPRKIGESIAAKLPLANRNRFRVEFVESTIMGQPTGKHRVEVSEMPRKEPPCSSD